MPFLHVRWPMLSPASADHTETLGCGEDAEAALSALCIALKMLHCAAGIMDATSKLLIHDGAAASAVQTLPPKYLSVEKSESKVARRQQPPKKLLVALLFFPSSVIMHSLRL